MSSITHADYLAMKRRVEAQKPEPTAAKDDAPEVLLHNEIIAYCNSQWPRWKFKHNNPAKKSTDTKGSEDFTIFMPGNRTVHIECKREGTKQDHDQLVWAKELELLGHKVHVVRSFSEFLVVVSTSP